MGVDCFEFVIVIIEGGLMLSVGLIEVVVLLC